MNHLHQKSVAVIVAHPDDETLWAGGTILSHPHWKFFIVCLSRRNDPDRSVKFDLALQELKSRGVMGDMDDGPDQVPLDDRTVQDAVLELLPAVYFDLVITHNPTGEYTRHLRHEETGRAVMNLWSNGAISAGELWLFAYDDGNKAYLPRPVKDAPVFHELTRHIWRKKYRIITKTFGFEEDSWEALTVPVAEAFWPFTHPGDAQKWLLNKGITE